MKKTIISFALVFALMISAFPAHAFPTQPSDTLNVSVQDLVAKDPLMLTSDEVAVIENEIDRIIDKMNRNMMQKAVSQNNSTAFSVNMENAVINVETASLESQLFDLGVTLLTAEELSMLTSNSEENTVSPQSVYTPPADTTNIKWYMSGPYQGMMGDGTVFKYFYLRAAAQNTANSLVDHVTVPMIEGGVTLSAFVYNMASIYVQKMIGQIPIIQWTPYELLFGNSLDPARAQKASDYSVGVAMTTTPKYVYMGPAGATLDNGNLFNLNFLTHMVSVGETHISTYVENGRTIRDSADRSYTVYCDNYETPLNGAIPNYGYGFAAENPDPIVYTMKDENSNEISNSVTPVAANINPYYVW